MTRGMGVHVGRESIQEEEIVSGKFFGPVFK